MSILSFPRLNFRGVFRTNPCTANNDDVMSAVVDRDSDSLGATLAGMTDAQVMAFLREQVQMSNAAPLAGQTPPACIAFLRAGWNLYGDHTTMFDDAVVTSVVTGPEPSNRITSAAQDPIVGQAVQLLGSASSDPMRRGTAMLCDLDSTGLVTSQVWLGGLQIGSGGDSGVDPSQIAVQLNHDTRAFQNWLSFFSTMAATGTVYGGEQNFVGIGCVMQFAIPASAIPDRVTFTSPGLEALLSAARAAAGLAVRFRVFEVQPGQIDETMAAAFQQGQALDNPALGYLVGTIGIWQHGEPETETAGRKLMCPYPRPSMSWVDPQGVQTHWPPQATPWSPNLPPAIVGNAVAQVQPAAAVISVDLVGAFPKYGFRDPGGPQKPDSRGFGAPKQRVNVGAVQLAVIPSGGGSPEPIAAIDYGVADYSTYEDFGGIVDLAFDPQLAQTIASGTLILQGTTASAVNAGTTLLQETPIRVVTDDRTMYLLPGTATARARIKLFDRGGPTVADTTLYLYEYLNIIQSFTPTAPPPPGLCRGGVRPNQTVSQDTRGLLTFAPQVTIPAGAGYADWYEIPIGTTASGATILAYQLDSTVLGVSVPAWSYVDYSSIRVYADDDFSALYAKGPLQWEDVYHAALRYYYLLFPAMSRIIPLNLADAIVKAGPMIKQRLASVGQLEFATTYAMPVTRTMSPAKVKLVVDFIDQQQSPIAT